MLIKGKQIADNTITENNIADNTITKNNLVFTDLSYTHEQQDPSFTWYITHNLNKFTNVTVYDNTDNTNTVVECQIDYVDCNRILLTFNSEVKGTAIVS